MKRTIPLLITAVAGFVLIVASFIPATESWGKDAAIWFDVLAAIAFILGGGSLLKLHLKKISDRAAGWGYSGVTLLAFLVTLVFGLGKLGTQPGADQEYFGETFAPLPLEAFPESQVTRIAGTLPKKASGQPLPDSVRRQMSEEGDEIVFRGWMRGDQKRSWMRGNQKQDLISFSEHLDWQCTVEKLFEQAQPPESLNGQVSYYVHHAALSVAGPMQPETKAELLTLGSSEQWTRAVEQLDSQSRVETSIEVTDVPSRFEIPASLQNVVSFDADSRQLSIQGPMSVGNRKALTDQFPLAKPLTGEGRDAFLAQLTQQGDALSEQQLIAFHNLLDSSWKADLLIGVADEAGAAPERQKTACEMLAEKEAGVKTIIPVITDGEDVRLNDEQKQLIRQFADDSEMRLAQLFEQLREAGPFELRQQQALSNFLARAPTVGSRNWTLYLALLRAGPLSSSQRDALLGEYRIERKWQQQVGRLFVSAHVPKYPWSGSYREQGTVFWWLYEYAFKPLTATMFAMLAFYVASAAFRAFRAKNLEAILLLGTAFIILLGRTFAGVALTSWLPESLSGLRIENLTVTIMSVFNTAGNRAIMIGIALGIASMSLKVLLGVDRSYLGSRED